MLRHRFLEAGADPKAKRICGQERLALSYIVDAHGGLNTKSFEALKQIHLLRRMDSKSCRLMQYLHHIHLAHLGRAPCAPHEFCIWLSFIPIFQTQRFILSSPLLPVVMQAVKHLFALKRSRERPRILQAQRLIAFESTLTMLTVNDPLVSQPGSAKPRSRLLPSMLDRARFAVVGEPGLSKPAIGYAAPLRHSLHPVTDCVCPALDPALDPALGPALDPALQPCGSIVDRMWPHVVAARCVRLFILSLSNHVCPALVTVVLNPGSARLLSSSPF